MGKRFGVPVCGINFVSCQIYSRLVTFLFKSHLIVSHRTAQKGTPLKIIIIACVHCSQATES